MAYTFSRNQDSQLIRQKFTRVSKYPSEKVARAHAPYHLASMNWTWIKSSHVTCLRQQKTTILASGTTWVNKCNNWTKKSKLNLETWHIKIFTIIKLQMNWSITLPKHTVCKKISTMIQRRYTWRKQLRLLKVNAIYTQMRCNSKT